MTDQLSGPSGSTTSSSVVGLSLRRGFGYRAIGRGFGYRAIGPRRGFGYRVVGPLWVDHQLERIWFAPAWRVWLSGLRVGQAGGERGEREARERREREARQRRERERERTGYEPFEEDKSALKGATSTYDLPA